MLKSFPIQNRIKKNFISYSLLEKKWTPSNISTYLSHLKDVHMLFRFVRYIFWPYLNFFYQQNMKSNLSKGTHDFSANWHIANKTRDRILRKFGMQYFPLNRASDYPDPLFYQCSSILSSGQHDASGIACSPLFRSRITNAYIIGYSVW